MRLIFSKPDETADAVIERLVTQCRFEDRPVSVVTSDNTIRATVGGIPVTRISSATLISDVVINEKDSRQVMADQGKKRMTVADRLDESTLAKLKELL